MKKMWLLFLTLLFPILSFANPNIVFIHIGNNLPSYTFEAIKQARLFNKNATIFLIACSDELLKNKDHMDDVCPISLESLEESKDHSYFIKIKKGDTKVNKNFWRFTLERFFYLEEFASQYNLENIFHLENDVMLYVNLETLLPLFINHYSNIAATFDNDNRCIAGFIYFKNKTALKNLSTFISKQAKTDLNDMILLSYYRQLKGVDEIDFLPIIYPDYINKHELLSITGNSPSTPSNYYKNFDQFESVFDAAALGQYLGGINPKNGLKGPGFINEKCVFNPSYLNIIWIKDEENRSVPYMSYKDKLIRINNLHIHCKNLKNFSSIK